MLVVVAYDIAAADGAGRRRVYQVAKICGRWGTAVQHSVYECEVDAGEYRQLEAELEEAICKSEDSIRMYLLGNRFQGRVVTLGRSKTAGAPERYIL